MIGCNLVLYELYFYLISAKLNLELDKTYLGEHLKAQAFALVLEVARPSSANGR